MSLPIHLSPASFSPRLYSASPVRMFIGAQVDGPNLFANSRVLVHQLTRFEGSEKSTFVSPFKGQSVASRLKYSGFSVSIPGRSFVLMLYFHHSGIPA